MLKCRYCIQQTVCCHSSRHCCYNKTMTSIYSVLASLLGGLDSEFWAERRIVVEIFLSHFKQTYESHLNIVYFRLCPQCSEFVNRNHYQRRC